MKAIVAICFLVTICLITALLIVSGHERFYWHEWHGC